MRFLSLLRIFAASFLVCLIVVSSKPVRSQVFPAYQVGVWGDYASIGNEGVAAEIQTNAYLFENTSYFRGDAFYVASTLYSGAFIEFGYLLHPGRYCLSGSGIGSNNPTCSSGPQLVDNGDPRWFWQYWSDRSHYYFQSGPAESAGPNGTWHTYSILSAQSNTWRFMLDGIEVSRVFFDSQVSRSPVSVAAEQVTGATPARLGPVQFRNISYLQGSTWHDVNSLTILVGCGVEASCPVPNPYGVSLLGPNYISAGSGGHGYMNGELIWSEGPEAMPLYQVQPFELAVGVSAAVLVGLLFTLRVFIRRRRRKQAQNN